jgi:hypothetical protein
MRFARDGDVPAPLPDSLRSRRIFGGRREHQLEFTVEPCLSGDARRCREALLGVGESPSGRVALDGVLVTSRADDWFWREWPPPVATRLLAMLEEEYGRERFARFWGSAEDVEQAFRTSFDTRLEFWAMQSLQRIYGRAPTGPRLEAGTLLLSFSALGLLVGVAIAANRRRTVG